MGKETEKGGETRRGRDEQVYVGFVYTVVPRVCVCVRMCLTASRGIDLFAGHLTR